MEYDKTIKYGVEPFNIMTSDKAELFHRFESGYFSNKLSHYANIADSLSKGDIVFGMFTGVFNDLYRCRKDNDEDANFEYFLPMQFVHDCNNYHPYEPDQFLAEFQPGTMFHLKDVMRGYAYDCEFKGVIVYHDLMYVGLGTQLLTLQALFEKYEIIKNGQVVPFGVKIEQKKTD